MTPIFLTPEPDLKPEKKLYIVSCHADFVSLSKKTLKLFNVLVFASSTSEAKTLADELLEDKWGRSSSVEGWKIVEIALIPSDYIIHAYTNHISTNN
jgi:hypothetical protein